MTPAIAIYYVFNFVLIASFGLVAIAAAQS